MHRLYPTRGTRLVSATRREDQMAAVPQLPDIDREETEDWLDSLHSIIERDGVERAHYLRRESGAQPRPQAPDVNGDMNEAFDEMFEEGK